MKQQSDFHIEEWEQLSNFFTIKGDFFYNEKKNETKALKLPPKRCLILFIHFLSFLFSFFFLSFV